MVIRTRRGISRDNSKKQTFLDSSAKRKTQLTLLHCQQRHIIMKSGAKIARRCKKTHQKFISAVIAVFFEIGSQARFSELFAVAILRFNQAIRVQKQLISGVEFYLFRFKNRIRCQSNGGTRRFKPTNCLCIFLPQNRRMMTGIAISDDSSLPVNGSQEN